MRTYGVGFGSTVASVFRGPIQGRLQPPRHIQRLFSKRRLGCVLIVLATSCAGKADTIYSSETAWAAAVPGATILNYQGLVSADGELQYGTGPGASTTLDSVTYTAVSPTNSEDYLGILGPEVIDVSVPTLAVGGIPAGPAALLITLPNPVNALGFFFDNDDTSNVTITLSDGTVETESSEYPTFDFFGITSTVAITSVEISNAAYTGSSPENAIFLSEFAYGPSVATSAPEPSSAGLMAVAVLMVLVLAIWTTRVRGRRPVATGPSGSIWFTGSKVIGKLSRGTGHQVGLPTSTDNCGYRVAATIRD